MLEISRMPKNNFAGDKQQVTKPPKNLANASSIWYSYFYCFQFNEFEMRAT